MKLRLHEASAGTGKTFWIVQEVLERVAQGVPIERILVVTFTEAASSELSARVRRRLGHALRGLQAAQSGEPFVANDTVISEFIAACPHPDRARARLAQALVDFDLAPISTLHSFCGRVLSTFAFESGAAFDAALQPKISELLRQIVTDHLLTLVHDAAPSVLHGLEAGGLSVELLLDLAHKVLDPDLVVLPDVAGGRLPPLGEWAAALDALRQAMDAAGGELISSLCHDKRLDHRRHGSPGQSYHWGPTQAAVRALWRWLDDPDPISPLPPALTLFRRASLLAATLPGQATPDHPVIGAFERCARLHEPLSAALRGWVLGVKLELVQAVRREAPRRVRDANLRTYDMLLRLLRDALRDSARGPRLISAIRARYDGALIDEFQDTDPVQWEIFYTLFPHHLQIIGDPKQAIYGFRGADVHTYHRAKALAEVAHQSTSYRCDGLLMSGINHLFGRLRRPFGADEPSYQPLTSACAWRGLDDPRPPLHIRHLPRTSHNSSGGVLHRWWLTPRLPQLVAQDIARELARGTRFVADGARLTPGHCAVLTRSNAQAAQIQAALRRCGVPSVQRGTQSVLQLPLAQELAHVLDGVLQPSDGAKRRRALVQPLMGRSADDLVLWVLDSERSSELRARFERWHRLWADHGFQRMFHAWLDDEGVLPRLLERPGGERRATDLLHLAELLQQAASRRELGPHGLVRWLRDPDDSEDSDLRLETDADAVQLFTMHSAKGLEFDLVWCPYLWSGGFIGASDRKHLKYYDPQAGRWQLDLGSDDFAAHLAARQREILQEDLRLAYVALTRAKHRCVIYWGPTGGRRSALGYLLHQPADAPLDQLAEHTWARVGEDDARLCDDLDQLARHEAIGWDSVRWDAPPAPVWASNPLRGRALALRSPRRSQALDHGWCRTSFSGLVQPANPVRAGAQPATGDPPQVLPPSPHPPSGAPIVLATLPGGTDTGSLLHEILEHHDFTQPQSLSALVQRRVAAYGFGSRWVAPIARGLQQALDASLDPAGQLRLSGVGRAQRLDELGFTLPLAGGLSPRGELSVGRLAQVFRGPLGPGCPAGTADALAGLSFSPVRGFLSGFIDLVFEHQGRWFLVDYKSNLLGPSCADYGPEALHTTMLNHHYTLQYHLYVVALHRYLSQRLAGSYDYARHFGGVFYPFLRGMSPAHGDGHSVFFDRPPWSLVVQLDALLRGSDEVGHG